jgi:hypothetical protein
VRRPRISAKASAYNAAQSRKYRARLAADDELAKRNVRAALTRFETLNRTGLHRYTNVRGTDRLAQVIQLMVDAGELVAIPGPRSGTPRPPGYGLWFALAPRAREEDPPCPNSSPDPSTRAPGSA